MKCHYVYVKKKKEKSKKNQILTFYFFVSFFFNIKLSLVSLMKVIGFPFLL
jgi:hypothetical protein